MSNTVCMNAALDISIVFSQQSVYTLTVFVMALLIVNMEMMNFSVSQLFQNVRLIAHVFSDLPIRRYHQIHELCIIVHEFINCNYLHIHLSHLGKHSVYLLEI